ncbi:MAG: succinate dehydrogenase, hydrophobic membrane anchor protein [Acidiferrobacterales bacterium]
MRMRVSSSSHAGLSEWLLQRMSAIYLGLFVIYISIRLILWPINDFDDWRSWLGSSMARVAWLLAFASTLVHAWIGIRSVFLDYLKPFPLRFIVSMIFAAGLIASGFWVIDILYGRGG